MLSRSSGSPPAIRGRAESQSGRIGTWARANAIRQEEATPGKPDVP